MDFGDALRHMKLGRRARRRYWADSLGGGAGMYAFLARPAIAAQEVPMLVVRIADGTIQPLGLSQWDALAEDWEVQGVAEGWEG